MARISRFPGTKFMHRDPPSGFGIRFLVNEDNSIFVKVVFDESKEGGKGILHGGAIAAVLDEAMGTAAFEAASAGYTATMSYSYASHIPLYEEVTIRAWVAKVEGKKIHTECEAVLADGTVAVTGNGLFIASKKLQESVISNPYTPENE